MKIHFEAQPDNGVIVCTRTDPEQRTIIYRMGGITPHKMGLTQKQWDEWCAACFIMNWNPVWEGYSTL